MKTSKESALSALMSAAMALPIVSLSVQAEEFIPPILPVGAEIGIRHLTYREAHERMKVNESVVWLKSPIGENWEVSASGTLDIISGASPIIVSNQSGRPMQILTGASITDRRIARDASVKRRWNDLTLGFSYAGSTEEDYKSHATGVSLALDFNQRNTTLTLSQGIGNDRVRSVTDTSLNERRDQREFLLGITQLIDRNSLVQSNLSVTRERGFLNDPYRLTAFFFNTGPRLLLSPDKRPDSRERRAWLNRYKRNLSTQQAVVTAEYRYYWDDWGIRAHTLYGSWLQTVNERWQWEAGLRYYTQKQAFFYRAEITTRPAPTFTSSDQRLAGFGALEPSARLIYRITDGSTIDLGISLYRQQGSWKLGGGSPNFEPLQAVLVNAGFVHRF